jgi:alkylation response protein AidB-like acyl-CoA dehydrogenase
MLARGADQLDLDGRWPAEQLARCAEAGVFEWFVPQPWGGAAWNAAAILGGYRALAEACLATTFVLTQRSGACQRIVASGNRELQDRLLPPLARGELFATVAISHLTTSRRHLRQPVLRAYPTADGFRLAGYSPWVTGAQHADYVVAGAVVMEGEQPTPDEILIVVPTSAPGVRAAPPAPLVALTASRTGPLEFVDACLDRGWVIAGPQPRVMASGGAATGGLQTSALAVGLAAAALGSLHAEAARREELSPPETALREELDQLDEALQDAARGAPRCSPEQLRQRANSLALRSTQAALAGAKGAGYVNGHPAGRWCREALFFLVWSCPQPVVQAHLCELAGLA